MPADALGGPATAELTALADGAAELRAAASAEDWDAVTSTIANVQSAWDVLQGDAPPMVGDEVDRALAAIAAATEGPGAEATAQGAIDLAQAILDLELQHLTVPEVDLTRFALWVEQLRLDATAGDPALIAGDDAILETIWQRVGHTANAAIAAAVTGHLDDLRAAADVGDATAAAEVAIGLASSVAGS